MSAEFDHRESVENGTCETVRARLSALPFAIGARAPWATVTCPWAITLWMPNRTDRTRENNNQEQESDDAGDCWTKRQPEGQHGHGHHIL